MKKNEEDVLVIFDVLKKLFQSSGEQRNRVGFRRANEKD
jgi:hypothetical protein